MNGQRERSSGSRQPAAAADGMRCTVDSESGAQHSTEQAHTLPQTGSMHAFAFQHELDESQEERKKGRIDRQAADREHR